MARVRVVLTEEGVIELTPRRQLDIVSRTLSGKVAAAGGEVRALYVAVPLLAVAAMLAPAVAHADPLDDYVSRKGKEVCAALDKADTAGDIFGLEFAIAHDGKFSINDAANAIERSAVADCPWDEPKVKQAGPSTATPATSPNPLPDH
jgi:hypothetical protein